MNSWLLLILIVPPMAPLCLTLFNLFSWPRGRCDVPPSGESVSVLIPARNEEKTIGPCVESILRSGYPIHELLVYDDSSTDRTRSIVEQIAAQDDRVRCVTGKPLPNGWIGKPHACFQLSQEARGDILVYADADTTIRTGGIARLLSLLHHRGHAIDIITAVPRQIMGTFAERLIMPLLVLTYTSWFPLRFVWSTRDPRFLAANGQLMAIRADRLRALGGFEAIATEIVDDMALCRLAKQSGQRVLFADGYDMAECRMYEGAGEIWKGFSKNFYEGIGNSPIALVFVVLLLGLTWIVPYPLLVTSLLGLTPDLLAASALGVVASGILRALLVIRYRHPAEGVLLHPVAVLGLIAIGINSFQWSKRGALEWAGRVYAAKKDRQV